MKIKICLYAIFLLVASFSVSCKQEHTISPVKQEEIAQSNVEIDHLPSWNDSAAKKNIIAFVEEVTNRNSDNYIEVQDRIATFDNDGCLWTEQPAYFQLLFALDRIKAMAGDHPEWKNKQPYKAVLEDDMKTIMAAGHKGLAELLMASHAGGTTEEFEKAVQDWIKTAKHPTKNVPYDQLVYQPMLELLEYLRAHNFKTFIVSGGGIEFMRAIVQDVYKIPAEQIIGSSIKTEFDYNNGNPVIRRLPEIDFIDDKEGKPVGINKFIGKKPVFAAGNSDGDLQMLQWTASNKLKNFELYIHHTDEVREWAYDKGSPIGGLEKGLEEAAKNGWTVVNMKTDWKVIYPFELK
ncbi:MAG: HAD family hydrolase [Lutimonas sp.]